MEEPQNTPPAIVATLDVANPPQGTRSRIVHILQIIGVFATFLGMADFLNLLAIMPQTDFGKWLMLSGPTLATSAKPLILLFGDILDNGVRDNSFTLPLALFLVASLGLGLAGCVGYTARVSTPYGSASTNAKGELVIRPRLPRAYVIPITPDK